STPTNRPCAGYDDPPGNGQGWSRPSPNAPPAPGGRTSPAPRSPRTARSPTAAARRSPRSRCPTPPCVPAPYHESARPPPPPLARPRRGGGPDEHHHQARPRGRRCQREDPYGGASLIEGEEEGHGGGRKPGGVRLHHPWRGRRFGR